MWVPSNYCTQGAYHPNDDKQLMAVNKCKKTDVLINFEGHVMS